MPDKPSSLARRAFTIVELLVAVGVTALLVALMVTITINVLTAWNRSSGNLSAGNQARLVLDQLSQDLQGAIIRRDNNVWLVATVQGDQSTVTGDSGLTSGQWTSGTPKPGASAGSLRINPTATDADENPNILLSIGNYRFGQAGVWLRFFSTPSDANTAVDTASAPRAISYQIVRNRIGGASNPDRVYSLYRSEVRPASTTPGSTDSTFGIGYDLLMDESAAVSYNRGDSNARSVGNVRRPSETFAIANDVIDFGIKLYGRDVNNAEVELFPVPRNPLGTPLLEPPSTVPFSFAVSRRASGSPVPVTGVAPVTYGYPTAADVMVRILTPEGVRLIQAIERGDLTRPPEYSSAAEHWWGVAIQNSKVYTRRIEIKS